MYKETLERANQLNKIINVTQQGLKGLQEIKSSYNNDDSCYWLNIFKHSDGSGGTCKLDRSEGNDKLIKVIEEELKRQLAEFEKEFNEL